MDERPIELHPAAIEAHRWYAERSSDTAFAFMAELDNAIGQILKGPEYWAPYLHGTRRYLFKRFPYLAVYRVQDDRILVVAIAHAKRRPGY